MLFDPSKVATYELNWWQAHHYGNRQKLYDNLVGWVSELFQIDKDNAKLAIDKLILSVKYHDTDDWSKCIEFVKQYYQIIKKISKLNIDAKDIADLEVGWWKLHDELEFEKDKSALNNQFRKLYSKLFNIDYKYTDKLGDYRVNATVEHDLAEKEGISKKEEEEHWYKCKKHLENFYTELNNLVS